MGWTLRAIIVETVFYLLIVALVGCLIWIFFFSQDNFCIEVGGMADNEDLGKECFRTPQEAIAFKEEIIIKYGLNEKKEGEWDFSHLNISLPLEVEIGKNLT